MICRRPGCFFSLAVAVVGTAYAATPTAPQAYASMAPLEQYLMADRSAEIAMARSAAPAPLSAQAKVLILGKRGYETVAAGHNGFTCLVERGFMSPFDSPEFWNPKLRGPVCYNAAASRSVLPYTILRTKLVLAGTTKAQLLENIRAAVGAKELSAPEVGAMSYMLSKQGYLGDQAHAWLPHLMFHLPKSDPAIWGANLSGSPVIVDTDHTEVPEPQTIFMVPVSHWSDGTPATAHDHN